jgi:hypothetical protein
MRASRPAPSWLPHWTDDQERRLRVLVFDEAVGQKSCRKSRSTLVEVHVRAAVRDDLVTDRLGAIDKMAVFGAHP